ncbi:MAG: MaoC/PaaZ C-terminal domain-containing protein [Dehalococcoidia bacterium]|nr:MaoC/PaaZ C-terminal domain-containing protein [Dehalococcoidia bacterium]
MRQQRQAFEYRVTAKNDVPDSWNPIHRDDYARSLGYPGGLVAGVTLYAFAADAAIRALGADWLERGYGAIEFRRPVFDGEELAIRAEPVGEADWRITLSRDGLRAEALAGPYREEIRVDDLERDDTVEPQVLVKDAAMTGALLKRADDRTYTRPELEHFLAAAGLEGTPLAAALLSRGLVPPSVLAALPFTLLWRNYPYSVVIHTASATEWVSPARLGRTLYSWGRVEEARERKGRFFVTQRVLTVDSEGTVVARMLHTGAYEPSR